MSKRAPHKDNNNKKWLRNTDTYVLSHVSKTCACVLSGYVISASVTPWFVALQAPLSMAFSRQEYWGGLPFPSPGDLSQPGIEPRSPVLQETLVFNTKSPGKPF